MSAFDDTSSDDRSDAMVVAYTVEGERSRDQGHHISAERLHPLS